MAESTTQWIQHYLLTGFVVTPDRQASKLGLQRPYADALLESMLVGMKPLESAIREFFQTDTHDVVAVYLFGSQARGTSGARSDIDIGVLLANDPPSTLEGLCLDLEGDLERWLARKVDLVVLNRAPPDLLHRILRDAHLLIDRDPSARIRFEVQARNEYFDLQPVLELCRRRKRTIR